MLLFSLQLLMCGVAVVDVDDWRKNTIYRGEYHDQHNTIQWFWKVSQIILNTLSQTLFL